MNKLCAIAAFTALLAACGSTTDDETGSGGSAPTIPSNSTVSVGDVEGISYNGNTLRVRVPLDGNSQLETYEADGELNGYQRFTQTESAANRSFTALAGRSDDGNLVAAVVADGGQFNRFYGGAILEQNNFSAPAGGLVSYQGNYVGLVNYGPGTTAPGAPDVIARGEATGVTGSVFLTADFADNKVEGAVYDRYIEGGAALDDLVLIVGDVAADGTFDGAIELNDATNTGAGSYSGAFGGSDAAFAGGVLDISSSAYGAGADPNTKEYGIFVIGQCPGSNAESCFTP